jgi:hypothetical protein
MPSVKFAALWQGINQVKSMWVSDDHEPFEMTQFVSPFVELHLLD